MKPDDPTDDLEFITAVLRFLRSIEGRDLIAIFRTVHPEQTGSAR